jgi:predicted adenine nucleotide alpha hydrolase (AANH) superfamily ATPase
MSSQSVLVHACCAHCTAYTIEYWRKEDYAVTAMWYNPNIHPSAEHQNRLEAMKILSGNMRFPLIVVEGYDFGHYFSQVTGQEVERCKGCFMIRLSKTAEMAQKLGIKSFTSSILISPHQKHKLARQTGEEEAGRTHVSFLYADLRKRYSDSRHITKPMELYSQQYCGCIFSKWERYSSSLTAGKHQTLPVPARDDKLAIS